MNKDIFGEGLTFFYQRGWAAIINLTLSKKLFNDTYFPYLSDYSHRYEVYYGG